MSIVNTIEKLETTNKLLKKMLQECIADMLNIGIPIAANNIKNIYLEKLKDCDACIYHKKSHGEDVYEIAIHDRFKIYTNSETALKNVRSSICHELIHTCPNCQGYHEDEFLKWAKLCDKKLNTQTLCTMDKRIYYGTYKGDRYVARCLKCGTEHWCLYEPSPESYCLTCKSKLVIEKYIKNQNK